MISGYAMMKNRHLYRIIFSVIAGIAISIIFLTGFAVSRGVEGAEQDKRAAETINSVSTVVHLYFADKNNSFLKAEDRTFLHSNHPAEFGKAIIQALIEGPRTGLMRTIPENSKLKAFYITGDETAYVDMSNEFKGRHSGGVKSELFTIYSMVDSLVLNIPEIHAVKFLIDGKESMTLNGHIDLRFPFKANMLLIR